MWLHLPITQSQYAVGIAVLTLASEKLSELQQSAMWRSKFQRQQYWQSVWKRDTSIRRLSGLTLKPSILNRGVEKWISSLEGSLANPSQSQGRNAEKMIQETSGPIQPDLLGGLGFQSSFLKMCRESSDTTSTPYDPNFERWVMKLRKDYSQRQKQAHPTGANDSLSWGIANWTTPLADDTNTRKNKFAQGGTPLSMQASNWPTPTTQETPHEDMELTETGRRKSKDGQNRHSLNLQDVSVNWNKETTCPTPNTRDTRRGCNQKQLATEVDRWPTINASEHQFRMQGNTQQSKGLTAVVRKSDIHSIHRGQEIDEDGHSCSPSCRRLNPLFAEHLMGLPLGWTCVSEPLEMELYRQWRQSLLSTLRRRLPPDLDFRIFS